MIDVWFHQSSAFIGYRREQYANANTDINSNTVYRDLRAQGVLSKPSGVYVYVSPLVTSKYLSAAQNGPRFPDSS
jgi:hypothetical protein